jgi:thiol-disulfide isomerase/thioredoxin
VNAAVTTRSGRSAGRYVPAWALALPVLVVLVAMVTGILLIESGGTSESVWVAAGHVRVGAPGPNFASWDLSGKKVSLSDYHARPVLLSFWATWCTVCRDELPALQGLQDRYRSEGLAILAVNYRESSSDRMRQYLAGLHVNLKTVIDPEGSIGSAYGVDVGLPVDVVSDRSGRVVQIMIGEVPIASVESAIKQVVAPAATS